MLNPTLDPRPSHLNRNLLPDLAHAVRHVERYTQHRPACPARANPRDPCGCGLYAAFDALDGALACLGVR